MPRAKFNFPEEPQKDTWSDPNEKKQYDSYIKHLKDKNRKRTNKLGQFSGS